MYRFGMVLPLRLAAYLCVLLSLVSYPCTADTLINFTDYSSFAARWLETGCAAPTFCGGFDYDISGTVDANDLLLFSDTWLMSKSSVLSDDIARVYIDRGIPTGTNRWVYDNGFALHSLYEKYRRNHNPTYLKYLKDWVDTMVDPGGNVTDPCYRPTDYNLDMILCGRVCLAMYNHFHEQRYKLVADKLIGNQLGSINQPRTTDEGFWHKLKYPYQMWVDGLYMAEPFAAQYGAMFNHPQWTDEAAYQLILMASHNQDPSTGLLYHAWADLYGISIDPNGYGVPSWADVTTGRSPEFWGRGIGWYSMALVDSLDHLPLDHPQRPQIIQILRDLASGLAAYQDPATGMWWQIVNKGYPRATYPTNYVESSCTGMFSYAIGKAVEKGYLDPNYSDYYRSVSRSGYEGLVANKVSYDTYGYVRLVGIVSGTSPGSYSSYMSTAQAPANDFKGLAALMLAALQYEKTPMPPDGDPPIPDPMTWALVPGAADHETLTMTASTAIDTSGVEYYFANVTDPSHDSGWQSGSTCTDSGLASGQTYTYKVKARDRSAAHNETDWSVEAGATTAAQLVYQAEDAFFEGQGIFETLHSGYTGTGYVNVTNVVGSYIEWTVAVPSAGLYTLTIRFANGTTAARTAEIMVNGSVTTASLSFAPTGAWTSWQDQSFDVTLEAGSNIIRATSLLSTGGPNYDRLSITVLPAD